MKLKQTNRASPEYRLRLHLDPATIEALARRAKENLRHINDEAAIMLREAIRQQEQQRA
jgi:hypothetical protein